MSRKPTKPTHQIRRELKERRERMELRRDGWIDLVSVYVPLTAPAVPAALTWAAIVEHYPGLLHVPTWAAVLIGLVPLVLLGWRINVLSMGDDEARALGVETGRLRLMVIAAATLATAAVTALAGVLGWVGLVIPHIARMLVGPDFTRLLPISILLGAGYLLIVDTLARTISGTEVPLGILTAVVGAPFFIWLLARGRRAWS